MIGTIMTVVELRKTDEGVAMVLEQLSGDMLYMATSKASLCRGLFAEQVVLIEIGGDIPFMIPATKLGWEAGWKPPLRLDTFEPMVMVNQTKEEPNPAQPLVHIVPGKVYPKEKPPVMPALRQTLFCTERDGILSLFSEGGLQWMPMTNANLLVPGELYRVDSMRTLKEDPYEPMNREYSLANIKFSAEAAFYVLLQPMRQ